MLAPDAPLIDRTYYPSRWDADRLVRTAFHEAGHATILLACGRSVDRVTIEPSGDTLGFMLPATPAVTWADRDALLRSIVAGPFVTGAVRRFEIPEAMVDLARRRLTERAARTTVLDDESATDDDELSDGAQIDRLLERLWPDTDEATRERHYECVIVETAALVRGNWVAVHEAVYLLLEHGTVDGATLTARVTPLLLHRPDILEHAA